MAVPAEESGSAERARTLLLPLSSRGRLRVKLGLASSISSRRGGDAGPVTVIAVWSSAAAGCARESSCAVIMVDVLAAAGRLLKAWLAAQERVQAGEVGEQQLRRQQ